MDKVRVTGKVIWVGKKDYKGKPYWRVGLVPEGEDKAVFLNLYNLMDAPGQKGDTVTVEVTDDAYDKARAQSNEKPAQPANSENGNRDERITKSVAIKAAAEAVQALPHTDISTLITNIKKLAAEFENYITGETPF